MRKCQVSKYECGVNEDGLSDSEGIIPLCNDPHSYRKFMVALYKKHLISKRDLLRLNAQAFSS